MLSTYLDPGAVHLAPPLFVEHAVMRSLLVTTVLPAPKRGGGSWTNERLALTPSEVLTRRQRADCRA